MIRLKISGMNCQHCVKAVRDTLVLNPKVKQVSSIDLETGLAEIEGAAQAAELIAAIQKAGYEAEQA